MARFPVLESPDGRVRRVITSDDEYESYENKGYKRVTSRSQAAGREPIDSGAEGNRRARESSTTEGSERNSGTSARKSSNN